MTMTFGFTLPSSFVFDPADFAFFASLISDASRGPTARTVTSGPALAQQTATQYWAAGVASSFILPTGTFSDGAGRTMGYGATLANGSALPSWLKFNAATRTLSGTDPAGTAATSIKITATDSAGLSASETFSLALASAPILVAQTATQYWTAGKSTSFALPTAIFSDPQGLALTYSATLAGGAALPSWLKFNASTRTFSGIDAPGTAPVAIKLTATDAVGLSVSESFTIALASIPTLAVQTAHQYWVAGKPTSFSLPSGTFVDPQNLALTYSATLAGGGALPSWLKFTPAGAVFSGTDASGTAAVNISVTATNNTGATASESFVLSLASAPVLAKQAAAQSWTEGSKLSFTLPTGSFTDPQVAALGYTATLSGGGALPSWLTFNPNTLVFSGTPVTGAPDLTVVVTATDAYGLSTSESFAATTPAAAGKFVINVTYDSTVAGAPAGFKTAVAAAVSYLETEFSNPVSLNITFGYGKVNGTALPANAVGSSQTSNELVSYSTLRAALASHGAQPDQLTALAHLPTTSPAGSAQFIVSNAQAKALGLPGALNGVTDGSVGISSANPMNWDPTNRAVSGLYDGVGAIEHEITEVMGRTGSLGTNASAYTALDLFRYSSPGVRDLVPGAGSFSIDGQTMLQAYNNPANGGDATDWIQTLTGDAFGSSAKGVASLVSAVDLREMNVIGWTRSSLTS